MKALTNAEEQVMQYIWQLKECIVRDVIDLFPEPKPKYSTVSTVIRKLVEKNYVTYKAYGKIHVYRPLISKAEYQKKTLGKLVSNYFDDSPQHLVSFFTKETDLSISDLEEIRQMIDSLILDKQSQSESHD